MQIRSHKLCKQIFATTAQPNVVKTTDTTQTSKFGLDGSRFWPVWTKLCSYEKLKYYSKSHVQFFPRRLARKKLHSVSASIRIWQNKQTLIKASKYSKKQMDGHQVTFAVFNFNITFFPEQFCSQLISFFIPTLLEGGGTIYSNGLSSKIMAYWYIYRRELRLVLLESLSSVEYGFQTILLILVFYRELSRFELR